MHTDVNIRNFRTTLENHPSIFLAGIVYCHSYSFPPRNILERNLDTGSVKMSGGVRFQYDLCYRGGKIEPNALASVQTDHGYSSRMWWDFLCRHCKHKRNAGAGNQTGGFGSLRGGVSSEGGFRIAVVGPCVAIRSASPGWPFKLVQLNLESPSTLSLFLASSSSPFSKHCQVPAG